MGAAWCRERSLEAHDSKSPLRRIILQICPTGRAEQRPRASEFNSNKNELDRIKSRPLVSQPVPIHTTHRPISQTHALNACSKWEDATLSVPETRDESRTPIPPPRKKKQQRLQQEGWKSIPRPPPPQPPEVAKKKRRQKALSTASLPNYAELSLSACSENPSSGHKSPPRSETCVPLSAKSSGLSSLTVEKIENCVRRCKSFGAFKPEQLKLKSAPRYSSESDDSFDGLDDWDLRVIEHCDAHEDSPPHTMLPTQRGSRKSSTDGKEDHREEISTSPDRGNETTNLVDQGMDQPDKISTSTTSHKETASIIDGRIGLPEEISLAVIPENQTVSPPDRGMDSPEETLLSDASHAEMTRSSSGCKVGQAGSPKPQEFEALNHPARPASEIDGTTFLVCDSVNQKNSTVDSRLANGFSGTGTPTGLKTPPPTPENSKSKLQERLFHQDDEVTHSSLLRLLKDYETADGKVEEIGVKPVLNGLGVPPTLRESTSRGSSRRSSMTPSLSELEAALSDLLEASASRTGAEEDEGDVTPPVQQTLRMISPKPFSAFSSSFHPVQTNVGSKQLETSA
ncbi:hypothetical protein B7P43_G14171 [Cryptotermes secundus]|uniref:Uncharacterized protein n=1 Tax=Cryptotermes secundus TaxID=105785 RepID=A0A2J7RPE0_9NEOP|nr:uncharacterized protein LOC111866451 [Cryptotermes secundus]PNF42706.1 hypothetical protein B7P43_G14171 [Cryptotermes secundus]